MKVCERNLWMKRTNWGWKKGNNDLPVQDTWWFESWLTALKRPTMFKVVHLCMKPSSILSGSEWEVSMTCLRTGHFPVHLFVVKVSVNHLLFKTVWWNGFWCSRFKCGVSSCSCALQLSNFLIWVDVSVVLLHSSLPNIDLITAVGYTWPPVCQSGNQETQNFPGQWSSSFNVHRQCPIDMVQGCMD